jgi:hypothetical protein
MVLGRNQAKNASATAMKRGEKKHSNKYQQKEK